MAGAAHQTRRHVAGLLRPRGPKLAGLMDHSEHDVPAAMRLPARRQPAGAVSKAVKRRADVVGIFPTGQDLTA